METVVDSQGAYTSLFKENLAAEPKISMGGNRARKTVTYIGHICASVYL